MDAAPNKRSYIRLAAIRALLMGIARPVVCQMFFRSDRMVRLWITQFNRAGIDGLITKARPGRPRKVAWKRVEDLLLPVLADPAKAGQVHWTGVKLHGYLQEQLSVELGYRTVIRWLHQLNFHLRVPRPWPERQNEQERQAFLGHIKTLCADSKVELWFADECGVEGDPRPRRRWVQPGQPRTVPYLGDHIRQNVIGAVCPQSGELFSLIVDGVDTDVFSSSWTKWPKPFRNQRVNALSLSSITPPGIEPLASIGTTLNPCFCRLTRQTLILSSGSGCGSRRIGFGTLLPEPMKN